MNLKKARTALFVIHRWLGIGMCLLFAMWFASGIVMMYVEYPELTTAERLDNLPALKTDQILFSPFDAAKSVTESVFSGVKLTTVLDRPSYQFTTPSNRDYFVFADSGELLTSINDKQALLAATQSGFHLSGEVASHAGLIDLDQWTLSASLNKHRPLHKIELNNASDGVLYISSSSGQVVRDTTRGERFWNWLGSTLHWIYPAILRQNNSVWRDVVVYVSLIGIVSVISGAVIGFMRIRIRNPYREGKDCSPYRGWMKWHHILGLLTLVFVSTFIFSGLMSMGPWGVFSSSVSPRDQLIRYAGDPTLRLSNLTMPKLITSSKPVKEIHWHQIQSKPHYSVVRSASDRTAGNNKSDKAQWLSSKIEKAIPSLIPSASLASLELITEQDDYYYSRHNRYRPLPVYRAKFNDANDSWFHIDAANGNVLNRVDNASRRERWLFNGLHSLDFQLLWKHRPLWDILVIALSLIGLGFSVTSVVVGWRRLTSQKKLVRPG
jgi:uncharacterized iron-regulated membrane protein